MNFRLTQGHLSRKERKCISYRCISWIHYILRFVGLFHRFNTSLGWCNEVIQVCEGLRSIRNNASRCKSISYQRARESHVQVELVVVVVEGAKEQSIVGNRTFGATGKGGIFSENIRRLPWPCSSSRRRRRCLCFDDNEDDDDDSDSDEALKVKYLQQCR